MDFRCIITNREVHELVLVNLDLVTKISYNMFSSCAVINFADHKDYLECRGYTDLEDFLDINNIIMKGE